jgi:hypothetical protein
MFCESYRRPLMDAAAAGQPMTGVLATHLAVCEACSSAFAEEQALFATIDRSLRAAANAAIPDLVVPRIQAAISQSESKGSGLQWRRVLVPATLCVCALSLVLFFRGTPGKELSNALPALTPASDQSHSRDRIPFAAAPLNSGQPLRASRKLRNVHRELLPPAEPQVLVDPTSQIAMNRLILLSRSAPDLVESFSKNTGSVSIEIKPIEVASIRWEPLSIESDVKNRTEPDR